MTNKLEPIVTDEGLILHDDKRVAAWVNTRCGGSAEITHRPYVAVGASDGNGGISAGCIIYQERDCDNEVSVACEDISSAKPRSLKAFFTYVFEDLKCGRLSAEIDDLNDRSIRQALMLGFKCEGAKRKPPDVPGEHIRVYGMLPSDCLWYRTKKEAAAAKANAQAQAKEEERLNDKLRRLQRADDSL